MGLLIDREKVIRIIDELIFEAQKAPTWKAENALRCLKKDLMKEQEAVKPVNVRWVMGINGGNCPKCMNWVQRTYNYCPFCGKAVKWDG